MELTELKRIFDDTDWVHPSGTPAELRAAEYLKGRCEALGVPARLEAFPVLKRGTKGGKQGNTLRLLDVDTGF